MPTILELFKGSPNDTNVKKETETLIEQETTGIRFRSAVELSNPLLYGNEAIRILNRSTKTLEIMKDSRGSGGTENSLLSQGISRLTGDRVSSIRDGRDQFNEKLGIPSSLIPTRVANDSDFNNSPTYDTHIRIGELRNDSSGTEFGQLLKKSGGTPRTIGRQVAGNAIGRVKDSIRNSLFNDDPSLIGQVPEPLSEEYSQNQLYSETINLENEVDTVKARFSRNASTDSIKGGENSSPITLEDVSPLYGVKRPTTMRSFKQGEGSVILYDDPNNTYTDKGIYKGSKVLEERGFRSKSDDIDSLSVSSTFEEDGKLNLIPFWISDLDGNEGVTFRAYLSSLNETISPSWNSDKFIGNPYSYHTFSGIERSVTFSLSIFPTSDVGLKNSWEKLKFISEKTYPSVDDEETYINPNFIRFRIGDMYNNRIALIESLNYNIEDGSTWETEIDGLYLPKYISLQTTFKLIETTGDELNLYDFNGSVSLDNNSSGTSGIQRANTSVSGETIT